jgi:membrane associated rhomboid family serine protease
MFVKAGHITKETVSFYILGRQIENKCKRKRILLVMMVSLITL